KDTSVFFTGHFCTSAISSIRPSNKNEDNDKDINAMPVIPDKGNVCLSITCQKYHITIHKEDPLVQHFLLLSLDLVNLTCEHQHKSHIITRHIKKRDSVIDFYYLYIMFMHVLFDLGSTIYNHKQLMRIDAYDEEDGYITIKLSKSLNDIILFFLNWRGIFL
ncbi:hypothetical protein ACJX0J_041035, partial [Zea mays]